MTPIQSILSGLTTCRLIEHEGASLLACVHPEDPRIGTLSEPTHMSREILARGEEFLIQQGCEIAWGPMEGCTWFSYRSNMGPLERPPFFKEPTGTPDGWLNAGYRKREDYFSSLQDNRLFLEKSAGKLERARDLGFRFRSLNADRLSADLEACHRLSHACFSEALGYARIPFAVFEGMYAPLVAQVPGELLILVENSDGDVVGYCLCFPEFFAPERKEFVIKSLAVDPQVQRASLATAMMTVAHQTAEGMGFTGGGIYALIRADAHSVGISNKAGADIFRRYALFEKSL